jgi:hypothetical protein|tara:strand:+ start:55 stop:231 length:177 start_codon:yes stop_codon:yes gene_type:complete
MKLPLTAYNIKYDAWLRDNKNTSIEKMTRDEHKKYVQEFLVTIEYGEPNTKPFVIDGK